MKIAIVTDWLVVYAGAERVLAQMLEVFPEADLFSLIDFFPEKKRPVLKNKKAVTSFIQKLPLARTKYRVYLPVMPLAVEQLDVSNYDVVISSSYAVAKGILTAPDQLHICYCHSPIRYAWDLQHQYLREAKLDKGIKSWVVRYILHRIRIWDSRTANGVDYFIANSDFIRKRIWKVYRRKAEVIYPPVAVEKFEPAAQKRDYYLTASRLVPYKKIDLIVEAFANMPDKQLVVIGEGPEFKRIKKMAAANVRMLGYQDDAHLKKYMQGAKAFIFAAVEDFGIVPVEAQACGTPVIALKKGGALETVRGMDTARPTGVFFDEQTVPSLLKAVEIFEENQDKFTAAYCRENAVRFAEERFRTEFRRFVLDKSAAFHKC